MAVSPPTVPAVAMADAVTALDRILGPEFTLRAMVDGIFSGGDLWVVFVDIELVVPLQEGGAVGEEIHTPVLEAAQRRSKPVEPDVELGVLY